MAAVRFRESSCACFFDFGVIRLVAPFRLPVGPRGLYSVVNGAVASFSEMLLEAEVRDDAPDAAELVSEARLGLHRVLCSWSGWTACGSRVVHGGSVLFLQALSNGESPREGSSFHRSNNASVLVSWALSA